MKKDTLTLEINEAVIKTELRYIQNNLNEKNKILLNKKEKINKWNEDKQDNKYIIKNLENIFTNKTIDKSSLNELKEHNNYIFDREINSLKDSINDFEDNKIH